MQKLLLLLLLLVALDKAGLLVFNVFALYRGMKCKGGYLPISTRDRRCTLLLKSHLTIFDFAGDVRPKQNSIKTKLLKKMNQSKMHKVASF